ncbi:YdeI/OmpD-associated family protein [Bdellovibrio sp. HCB290]|uniref:YdeI/OmpD-associated family protein n=1 Tax=Bdellovibrio sp. HCB290 TaxID=3394356 RepID=UPI0039B58148
MNERNPKVDSFLKNEKKWPDAVKALRELALSAGLQEDFKWRFPCYSHNGKNVIMIQIFKNFGALMFFDGNALKDPKKILKAPGENSHVVKRFEFQSMADVTKAKAALKTLITQAMKFSESPVKSLKKVSPPKQEVASEFKDALDKNKKLKTAFDSLTPGRQRMYLLHFSSAKQAETRVSRVKKCIPRILMGKGLMD